LEFPFALRAGLLALINPTLAWSSLLSQVKEVFLGRASAMPANCDMFDYYARTAEHLPMGSEWCAVGVGPHLITLNDWCVATRGPLPHGVGG
jgi:hypothetical protein